MKKKALPSYREGWRYGLVIICLGIGVLGLLWRMVQLTIVDRPFLQQQGQARTMRTDLIPASRGMIVDRNLHPLAVSSPVLTVWVNPPMFSADDETFARLAKLLEEKPSVLKKKLASNEGREFVYLKRQIEPGVGEQIEALKIPGLHLQREYRRFYPEGEVAAHVVGFTNIDELGQEGMELAFEKNLQGIPGKQRVLKDRLGHVVSVLEEVTPARPGQDIVLSLDYRIQYLAYRELKKAVELQNADSGSIVVLDSKTGEVLAMANQPSYNPNSRVKEQVQRYRNRAVTDVLEPGSTMKAFSVVNAMEQARFTPTSKIDISPGWMVLNGKIISDEHYHEPILDVTTILQKSSNMGVAKMSLATPPESLWNLLHGLGFGESTDSGFPGEVRGSLQHHRKFTPLTLATLSFGYGMSVTNLQLALAYAALGNGGMKYPVTFLKQEAARPAGTRVMQAKVAKQVVTMLETVLDAGGTATRARVLGYRIAGKTGTARQVGSHGYDRHRHNALFVGLGPVSRPRLVVSVVINNPKAKDYYGSLVAAPVFAKVMEGALRTLNVAPDDLAALQESNDGMLLEKSEKMELKR